SVEKSLRRLNTDYIDLLWVHAYDFTTPISEMMRALDDLVRAGKILYIGISDAPAWVIARANTLAEERNMTPFIGNQLEYNLTERSPERELLPMSDALNIGVVAWSPLSAGILTGKYIDKKGEGSGGRMEGTTSYRLNDRNTSIAKEVVAVAKEMGASPAQVALAWINQKGVIPIIGARKMDQLKDNIASLDIHIPDELMARLDEVSKIDLGFPHDFVLRPGAQKMIYGDMVHQIKGIRNPNL
ncbi:MAG: aldo/keto reductase, partial [Bacteroidota bacterium]